MSKKYCTTCSMKKEKYANYEDLLLNRQIIINNFFNTIILVNKY